MDWEQYFEAMRYGLKVDKVAKTLGLKKTELEALIFMGNNGFDVPLEKQMGGYYTTKCIPERGPIYVSQQIGLKNPGNTVPDLVRKKLVTRMTCSDNGRQACVELTPKGTKLYNKALGELSKVEE